MNARIMNETEFGIRSCPGALCSLIGGAGDLVSRL